jgi:hypothetical protein
MSATDGNASMWKTRYMIVSTSVPLAFSDRPTANSTHASVTPGRWRRTPSRIALLAATPTRQAQIVCSQVPAGEKKYAPMTTNAMAR